MYFEIFGIHGGFHDQTALPWHSVRNIESVSVRVGPGRAQKRSLAQGLVQQVQKPLPSRLPPRPRMRSTHAGSGSFQRPMNRPRSPDAYNKDSAGAALGKPNGCWQSGNIVNGSISSRDFPFLSWHTPPSTPQHNAGLHTSHAPTSTKSFLSTCHMPLTRSSSQNTLVQTLQPQTLGTTLANPPAASDLPCGCSTMRTLPLRSYHMLLFACLPVLAALLLCCCCCCCCCCLLLFVFACCFAAAGLPMLLLLVCCFAAAGLRVFAASGLLLGCYCCCATPVFSSFISCLECKTHVERQRP